MLEAKREIRRILEETTSNMRPDEVDKQYAKYSLFDKDDQPKLIKHKRM